VLAPEVPRSAGTVTTTCSPERRPLVISTWPPLVMPVVTTRLAVVPLVETVTVVVPFDRAMALLGTARTFA
jgi:hypothetical protein